MTRDCFVLKAADVVCAALVGGQVSTEQIPALLEEITHCMLRLSDAGLETGPVPAVPIEDSYTDDYIICLEDGKKVTLLRRYLKKQFDMAPEEYLEKWNLPEDYPFVTKSYSATRSQIAKGQGLGKSP